MTGQLNRRRPRLPDNPMVVDPAAGDSVRYIGEDPKIQADYGGPLTIVAIDIVHGRAICITPEGRCLVGVAVSDLQKIRP